ncbi:MAG: DUF488 family protein [Dehalococcoidia bacterium]|nr:DUF488 family protein [Dehalococcoidia bacterium]MCB9610545.1 DUF488 family protein [Polyangiaceae bacterium]
MDRLWPQSLARRSRSQVQNRFGHRPARWEESGKRYRAELDRGRAFEALHNSTEIARRRRVALVFGVRNESLSHAGIIREASRSASYSEVK